MTLVSLNGDLDNNKGPSEIKHVHHHHFVPAWAQDQHPGGSQTLPNRKGSKKVALKPASADDSDVVIKKAGLNGVKIQLNLNEQENEKQVQTSLDFDYSDFAVEAEIEKPAINPAVVQSEKRKYTLEELEVEGFSGVESTSSSKNSEFEEDLEEEEEVDLNSLIEGDVDEIDEEIGKFFEKTSDLDGFLIIYPPFLYSGIIRSRSFFSLSFSNWILRAKAESKPDKTTKADKSDSHLFSEILARK